MSAWLREDAEGVSLRVRVRPRARHDAVAGERDGALLVRLAAPALEGRANAALCRFLGKTLGVAPSRVQLVSGSSGRDKRVRVSGLGLADAKRRLGLDDADTRPATTPR